ncbi:DNA-binding transcriptional LysR family regulator [Comamonas odontotermitis]|uniref:DNA-binding transcriptional LysR family regulator n=1 Tax=Comamonas odontotermitis TaxID=379895 RepID=A0ABR6RFK7_9BURK|nr:LysR family transcriptional regulator [Comamonas odontotermitis]MBB6577936.1 DNA-binding transcriptional LysR family regulator [Comamonas odontotermitis]
MLHLRLRQWEVFCAIAQSGSTVAAADAVGLSQSAVSAALQQLEAGMGAQLFARTGKRLILNDLGRSLWPEAQALLEQAQLLEQATRATAPAAPVQLRLAASTTIANHVLPPILAGFMQRYEQVRFDVVIGNTREVAQSVTDARVDLGFIEGASHWTELEVQPWRDDELVLIAAAGDALVQHARQAPLTVQELRACRWLLREEGSGTREAVEFAVLSHLHEWPVVAVLGSSEAICTAVARGAGISCLSRVIAQPWVDRGELAILPTELPAMQRPFSLLQRRGKKRSPVLQALVQACTDAA